MSSLAMSFRVAKLPADDILGLQGMGLSEATIGNKGLGKEFTVDPKAATGVMRGMAEETPCQDPLVHRDAVS